MTVCLTVWFWYHGNCCTHYCCCYCFSNNCYSVAVIAVTASEQIWILFTADTYTDTLPWAWSHVTVTQITYIKWPIVDLDRWRVAWELYFWYMPLYSSQLRPCFSQLWLNITQCHFTSHKHTVRDFLCKIVHSGIFLLYLPLKCILYYNLSNNMDP